MKLKKEITYMSRETCEGIFVPCITDKKDIKEVVNSTKLPINVMCMPDLPDFKKLADSGVKRISMGNFVNEFAYTQMENKVNEIIKNQSFEGLF